MTFSRIYMQDLHTLSRNKSALKNPYKPLPARVLVRLSEKTRKRFKRMERCGIIETGEQNEIYQRNRQSADDNGDMEYRGRSDGE